MTYRATIRHSSVARARVIDTGTDILPLAKRRASAEFGGEQNDHVIVILGDPGQSGRHRFAPQRRQRPLAGPVEEAAAVGLS